MACCVCVCVCVICNTIGNWCWFKWSMFCWVIHFKILRWFVNHCYQWLAIRYHFLSVRGYDHISNALSFSLTKPYEAGTVIFILCRCGVEDSEVKGKILEYSYPWGFERILEVSTYRCQEYCHFQVYTRVRFYISWVVFIFKHSFPRKQ